MSLRTLRYAIWDVDRWVRCKKAAVEIRWGKEWLRYELADGTIGLARPDTWKSITKVPSL